MKAKWKISILSTLLSVSFLSACNLGNNEIIEQEEVDYQPVRYESDYNQNQNNEETNPANRSTNHDENPENTEKRMEKGDDLEFDKDRGAE